MNAVKHGFWDDARNDGESIALVHSELSEALEAMRQGNPSSDKIIEFSAVEEELADAVIRIMDYAMGKDLDIAGAIIAKLSIISPVSLCTGKRFSPESPSFLDTWR